MTSIDDPVTLAIAAHKPLVYRLLAREGLRTPRHLEFALDEVAKAVALIEKFGGEWVVKPAGASAGRGVTTGVTTQAGLLRAVALAAAFGPTVVIEEQVRGEVYRLLYLDGKLLDAVLQRSPVLIGDGTSSVRQLVRRENLRRLSAGSKAAQFLLSIDLDMRRTLAKQHLSLSSVPNKGALVKIKTVVNENSTRDTFSAAHQLCASIIADGAAAARAVGARLAGVDVLTSAPNLPLARSGGVILEVNTTPGYHYHYYKQGGESAVAVEILSCLLSQPYKQTTNDRAASPSTVA